MFFFHNNVLFDECIFLLDFGFFWFPFVLWFLVSCCVTVLFLFLKRRASCFVWQVLFKYWIYCCLRPEEAGRELMSLGGWFFGHTHMVAYGIFVSQPGIEPGPTAVKAWCPDLWTTREFPRGTTFENVQVSYWVLGNFLLCWDLKCQKADFLWASLLKEDAFDWGLLHLVQGRPLYSSSYRDLTSCAGTTLTLSWFGVLALIGLEAPFVVSTPVCSDYCFLFPH